ncbi:hypothetical protein GCM10008098_27250 [Rhodanobacter panaciterrae]|uniref:Uncharacterized protein n=1 Tax=Rhodanobacter panaciterrae TaxID=490572 RepID=A0ABQ3A1V6_9GAMM|nr:hypothetical protein [Rhodanobacter panaciterrae]GGY32339.1 hypothetical protein GCM10008098_27250 [Rhodanobacter panaciterrae]
MSSLWTNLLFLHGHVTHNDLPWRPDTRTTTSRRKPAPAKPKTIARMCCAAVWPRLVGPR